MTVVWDPYVRIFHWSLAAFFVLAYTLEGEWRQLHSHAGYTVALLVGFRILWGFIGPRHALFTDFVASPRATFAYLHRLYERQSRPYTGHDPAGAVMIVCLLICLALTAMSGMVLYGMEGNGPLAGTFVQHWPGALTADIHDLLAHLTVFLAVAHVAGVLVTSRLHGENLIAAMITGRKKSRE